MKLNIKQKKALTKLNNAITNLPEFEAVMKLVPSNVAITNCELMECDQTLSFFKNKVSYVGIVPTTKGVQPYLMNLCGQWYFESSKPVELIANDIARAMQDAKSKDSFKVSQYLMYELNMDMTDEVYPHMRSNAIGVFTANGLKN